MPHSTDLDESDEKARHSAAAFIRYFEPLAATSQKEPWHDGLSAAREWLRLIAARTASSEQVTLLLGIAHANVYNGSGWHAMALEMYAWAKLRGYQVPDRDHFFDFQVWRKSHRPPKRRGSSGRDRT